MNCKEFHQQFEYLEKGAIPHLTPEQAQHVNQCSLCETYWKNRVVSDFLHQASTPPVLVGLEERILAKASSNAQERRTASKNSKKMFVGGALAASLALSVGLWYLQIQSPEESIAPIMAELSVNSISLPLNQVSNLPVMIEASQQHQAVVISVALGPSLALQNYEGIRELRWNTSLETGANVIHLPLLVSSEEGDMVTVTVESDDGLKTYQFKVRGEKPAKASNGII